MMRKVTKEEFYAKVGPMDVTCRPERDETLWETRNRTVIGRSTPGYMCRDADGIYTPKTEYFLAERVS